MGEERGGRGGVAATRVGVEEGKDWALSGVGAEQVRTGTEGGEENVEWTCPEVLLAGVG